MPPLPIPIDLQLETIKLFLYAALRADPVLATYIGPADRICRRHQGNPPVVLRGEQKVQFSKGSLPALGVYQDPRDRTVIGPVEGAGLTQGFSRTIYAMWGCEMQQPGAVDAYARAMTLTQYVGERMKWWLIEGGLVTTPWGEIDVDEFCTMIDPLDFQRLPLLTHNIAVVEMPIKVEHVHPSYPLPNSEISEWIVKLTATHEPDPGYGQEIEIDAEYAHP